MNDRTEKSDSSLRMRQLIFATRRSDITPRRVVILVQMVQILQLLFMVINIRRKLTVSKTEIHTRRKLLHRQLCISPLVE